MLFYCCHLIFIVVLIQIYVIVFQKASLGKVN